MTIKLADIISNVSSIAQFDPGFAAVYLPERARVLDGAGGRRSGTFSKSRAGARGGKGADRGHSSRKLEDGVVGYCHRRRTAICTRRNLGS